MMVGFALAILVFGVAGCLWYFGEIAQDQDRRAWQLSMKEARLTAWEELLAEREMREWFTIDADGVRVYDRAVEVHGVPVGDDSCLSSSTGSNSPTYRPVGDGASGVNTRPASEADSQGGAA